MFQADKSNTLELMKIKSIKSYEFYFELEYERDQLWQVFVSFITRTYSYKPGLLLHLMTKISKYGKVVNNVFFICELQLAEFLQNLNNTQIAFVTTRDDMDFHWDILQKALTGVQDNHVQLAINRKTNDPFLQNPSQFMVTKGSDELREGAAFRIRVLISSGIFGLWERWEKIRFTNPQGISVPQIHKDEDVVPLGLRSTNIYLIFYLLIGGLILSILSNFAEIIIGRRAIRKRVHRCSITKNDR
ncbi:unnamed protein product [Allacma fusca]|uniref:Uncharacterized protein n=1 Tax=Allacma fusca TaxID=39272 RepID=A0A8J2K7K6_9HEXA|nr:unnamed protein product [Allacma fusca]